MRRACSVDSRRMDFEAELLGASTYAAITRNRAAAAQEWVNELPKLVSEARRRFALTIGEPFTDGRSSCVLAVSCADGRLGVLKLAPPWHNIRRELQALVAWDGVAAPSVIAADTTRGLLLMERVMPGETVSEMTVSELAELSARVHRAVPAADFPSVQQEISRRIASREAALAKMAAGGTPTQLDRRALVDVQRWARRLARGEGERLLCHGDFYSSKNVLRCECRGPLVIDPFPCVGEREYDFALWVNTAESFVAEPAACITELALELALDERRLLAYVTLLAGAQLCGTSDERRARRERFWRTVSEEAYAVW